MSLVNKTQILALIQPLTGLLPGSVTWARSGDPMVSPIDQAIANLQIIHFQAFGTDDVATNSTDTTFETVVTGVRGFTLQVRVDCYGLDAEAQEIVDLLRLRLQAPWVTAALTAINYSLISVGDSTDLGADRDNRVISSASVDIVFGGKNYVNQVETGTGWIERINSADDVLIGLETIVCVQVFGPSCSVVAG